MHNRRRNGTLAITGFVAAPLAFGIAVSLLFALVWKTPTNLERITDSANASNARDTATDDTSHSQPAPRSQWNLTSNAFLNKFCMECHSSDSVESSGADVDFELVIANNSVSGTSEFWESVFHALDDQYMPPANHAQPSHEQIEHLKQAWVQAQPGSGHKKRSTVRRLNRFEYENTIRDLFELKNHAFDNPHRLLLNDSYYDPRKQTMPDYVMALSSFKWGHRKPAEYSGVPSLPHDAPVEHGFNNNSEVLSISPMQLETCFEIARKLVYHDEFPFSTPLWNDLFESPSGSRHQRLSEAKVALENFLPRAFRRPISEQEASRWLQLFETEWQKSRSYQQAMMATVSGVLVSPAFLFRFDAAENEEGYSDHQIASRLSFFLWGSMPDAHLSKMARAGLLQSESKVRREVKRMLQDPRSKALSQGFAGQWLGLQKSTNAKPDKDRFPEYYLDLVQSPPGVSMAIEQMLLFESVLIENRSILEFVDTDFGYVNRLLMDWYGIDPQQAVGYVPGINDFEDFFRIKWPSRERGGIIAAGATMLSTSTTNRTSPVYRGAWILETILNRPPPAPPANIPPLMVTQDQTPDANIRERLKRHRLDPNCASCHNRIDPPGFAMEQFDPIGRFRSTPENTIDSVGQWQGESVNGIIELKDAILKDKQAYARGFIEHLLEYSMGRSLTVLDEKGVDNILQRVSNSEYKIANIIEEVAVHSVHHGRRYEKPPIRLAHPGLHLR